MENRIASAETTAVTMVFSAKSEADRFMNKAKAILTDRKGQGALDTAIQVLVSVVLGALILAGLYLILNATVLPNITERIKDMFNYKG